MATLTKPFEGYTKHDFFANVVRGGERPPINKRWPKEFAELLQACWDPNPANRPPMCQVHTEGWRFVWVCVVVCGSGSCSPKQAAAILPIPFFPPVPSRRSPNDFGKK